MTDRTAFFGGSAPIRYAGPDSVASEGDTLAQSMAKLNAIADRFAARVEREAIEPRPRSGRQEYLENLVNRFM